MTIDLEYCYMQPDDERALLIYTYDLKRAKDKIAKDSPYQLGIADDSLERSPTKSLISNSRTFTRV